VTKTTDGQTDKHLLTASTTLRLSSSQCVRGISTLEGF